MVAWTATSYQADAVRPRPAGPAAERLRAVDRVVNVHEEIPAKVCCERPIGATVSTSNFSVEISGFPRSVVGLSACDVDDQVKPKQSPLALVDTICAFIFDKSLHLVDLTWIRPAGTAVRLQGCRESLAGVFVPIDGSCIDDPADHKFQESSRVQTNGDSVMANLDRRQVG